ncbi:hypothetical protein [Paraburkholderia terrae]|uniref:Uncharacterized protein n=1 Tax=Paraburkholderia terrae TaxID=311230 RepID=A0ABN6JWN0_9BURK|nr:hypothetical protein [Paraburkholderia terrae]BCZ84554.1 hypothetical protein PTKU64_82290 [Paraburkholderia terrae]BDC45805.1 hypothetical protein PTKU15_91020 [Paraburkholderia terrae]
MMNAQTIKHGVHREAGKPRGAGVEVIAVAASAVGRVPERRSFRSTASPGPGG